MAARRTRGARSAETWIAGAVGGAVLLTCHSIGAILTVGEFARKTGRRYNIHRYRRANLLDLTASTFPIILPYFIPVILAAGTTSSGSDHGIPSVSPSHVELHNFHSFAVQLVVIAAIATGVEGVRRRPCRGKRRYRELAYSCELFAHYWKP